MRNVDWIEVETRPCIVCGETGMVKVQISDYREWQTHHNQGLTPDMLSSLTLYEKEQLISGVHEVCYLKMFPEGTFED